MKRRIEVSLEGQSLSFWEGARVAALLPHLPDSLAERVRSGLAWLVDRHGNQVALEGPLEPHQAYGVKESA